MTSPHPYEDLEQDFSDACDVAVDECKSLGYTPTIWISMSRRLGAAEAARQLLISGDIQSGFERLIKEGRPDLTIEWAALQPRWAPLFSNQHRACAQWRLEQAGVPSESTPR